MKEVHRKRRLTITTRKADSIVEIKVKDNGHGIKPEIMDRIFDPFFTTRPAGEGTGLGLSLCYGIVTEHNGRIYAESKPGRGATFVVELPIVSEVAQPVQMPIEFRQKLTGSRILVVDDEPVIRDFINQVLSWEGCEVDTAASAEEALQKIASQQYNLLLLDIKMPGMDGIELYNRVKRLGRSLARRVVFITGDVISHGTERFLTENKLPHIEKPFTATQLIDKLGRTLRAGR
jgi:CheY-like chemotaxis protein